MDKQRRDALNQKYLDIVEQERLYFKTVKDFTEVGLYVVVLSLFVQHCYGRRDNKQMRVKVESEISTALQSLSMSKIKRCLSVLVVCYINVQKLQKVSSIL